MRTQKTTKAAKRKKVSDWENVKLPRRVMSLLRENKRKTLIPITSFVEQAVMEKLSNN